MEDFMETAALLARTAWNATCLAWKAYNSFADSLGKPWTMMVHSTVFGTIGSAVAGWLLSGGGPGVASHAGAIPIPTAASFSGAFDGVVNGMLKPGP